MEKNPFVWLSGADPDILKQCTKLPKTERRKFAGFGTTVLIPATLGLFSMGYALSTFTSDPKIYITGGVLWFFIVLAIDRFLVSTLYKSSVQPKRNFWIALFFRLIFAVFVGIAVSHPLVLFLFDKSIETQIAETERARIDNRLKEIEALKENAQLGEAATLLKEKTKTRDCLDKVLQAERTGALKGEVRLNDGTLCGYSSGDAGCFDDCDSVKEQLKIINAEIAKLEKSVSSDVDAVGKTTEKDIDKIKGEISRDYPARVRALAVISRDEPHIWWVESFLMLFFVFIDALLILLKGTTSMGEYEEIRDSLLFEVQVTEKAKREAVEAYASTVYRATVEAERTYDARKNEIITLIKVTNNFIKEQENQRDIFEQQMKAIARNIKTVKDADARRTYTVRLADLRNTFNESWSKALTRFQEYLRSL